MLQWEQSCKTHWLQQPLRFSGWVVVSRCFAVYKSNICILTHQPIVPVLDLLFLVFTQHRADTCLAWRPFWNVIWFINVSPVG